MEHEISMEFEPNATCKEVMCTKCGSSSEDFRHTRWVCDDIFTRVEAKVFGVSKHIKSWSDVMSKLARLYCLNSAETQSGFEPQDVILEKNEDYVLLRDDKGLLLIVIHDQDNTNVLEKMKEQPIEVRA